MGVDPTIAGEAATLTAIGMGTAFVVLVLLLIVISLIGVFNRRISDDAAPSAVVKSGSQPTQEDVEARDRALAAVLAVTALMASRPHATFRTGEDG